MIIKTRSKEETFQLGAALGREFAAQKSESNAFIVAVDGELGAGKTVLTGGLASAVGIDEPILSPSFTIVKEYDGCDFSLFHVDLYRLTNVSDLMTFDFYEYAGSENSITVIEWAKKFNTDDYLPCVPVVFVNVTYDETDPENGRIFDFEFRNLKREIKLK
ncbi:MAG: tRNA (adenosine(37)-N6)-threonylcarbamoyltransferase complex ATPase subunit type 1 TsaE [Candidatus Wallbacteria bacterium]